MLRKEDSQQVIPEDQVEQYSPQDFLEKLYTASLDWLMKEKGGKIIAEFGSQEIEHWDSHEFAPGREIKLGIGLKKAVLIETTQEYFALALGERLRSKYQHKASLGFQFGLMPNPISKHFREELPVDQLRALTNPGLISYGKGEFYLHDMSENINVNAWADSGTFGGVEVQRWKQNDILTNNGANACLEIVQRTAKNAFR